MHGMYVCTPQLAGGNPIVGPNSFKTLGEGPRLVPAKRGFPLLTVPTPEGWKAKYTLASRMQIHESLTDLALLTRGETRTSNPWICSLMLNHLSYLTTYIVSISELLCLIPILVGSSVATVCPPERDTALRTAVTTVTRVPL